MLRRCSTWCWSSCWSILCRTELSVSRGENDACPDCDAQQRNASAVFEQVQALPACQDHNILVCKHCTIDSWLGVSYFGRYDDYGVVAYCMTTGNFETSVRAHTGPPCRPPPFPYVYVLGDSICIGKTHHQRAYPSPAYFNFHWACECFSPSPSLSPLLPSAPAPTARQLRKAHKPECPQPSVWSQLLLSQWKLQWGIPLEYWLINAFCFSYMKRLEVMTHWH